MSGSKALDSRRKKWVARSLIGVLGVCLALPTLRLPLERRFRETVCRITPADLYCLAAALEEYAADHDGLYPSDLAALLSIQYPRLGYLRGTTVPCDPWNRPYLYELKPGGLGYRVGTLGSDGIIGGVDDACDEWMEK